MCVCYTVSADSQTWKSSLQPGVFDAHPSIKSLSADLHVSPAEFSRLKMFSDGTSGWDPLCCRLTSGVTVRCK